MTRPYKYSEKHEFSNINGDIFKTSDRNKFKWEENALSHGNLISIANSHLMEYFAEGQADPSKFHKITKNEAEGAPKTQNRQ